MVSPTSTAQGSPHPHVGTVYLDGTTADVSCRITFDGVEYVGRLWFLPHGETTSPLPDRAAIGGRSPDEVLELACRLSNDELAVRYRRARSEKRRFLALRRATDEILANIRYMNQVAISVDAGLIDRDGANQEMEQTERQIVECVARLRHHAGLVEE